jgi:hypothetical protein
MALSTFMSAARYGKISIFPFNLQQRKIAAPRGMQLVYHRAGNKGAD